MRATSRLVAHHGLGVPLVGAGRERAHEIHVGHVAQQPRRGCAVDLKDGERGGPVHGEGSPIIEVDDDGMGEPGLRALPVSALVAAQVPGASPHLPAGALVQPEDVEPLVAVGAHVGPLAPHAGRVEAHEGTAHARHQAYRARATGQQRIGALRGLRSEQVAQPPTSQRGRGPEDVCPTPLDAHDPPRAHVLRAKASQLGQPARATHEGPRTKGRRI